MMFFSMARARTVETPLRTFPQLSTLPRRSMTLRTRSLRIGSTRNVSLTQKLRRCVNSHMYICVLKRPVQPADWDEDAPFEVLDGDAVKPEGWLDDEPLSIPDPGMYTVYMFMCVLTDAVQMLRSLRSGTTRRTVTGLHLPSLTPSVRKHPDAVNGTGVYTNRLVL